MTNWYTKWKAQKKAEEIDMMLDDYVNARIIDGKLMIVVKGIVIDPDLFKEDIVTVVKQIREINR